MGGGLTTGEATMTFQDRIAQRFVCAKCSGTGATVKRIAASGTGLSKFFDIQHNTFIAASCRNCGYTEIYNPEVLEGKDRTGAILDILFGG
jgi:predicted nucleic-acid-binding Zn-ribbon protein